MSEPTTTKAPPTIVDADKWFNDKILPQRTTSAGFAPNRVWKGPRALVKGNQEDPNGLCGDASLYVYEQFFRDFGDYRTSDGHHIGLILWDGLLTNHIANVMLQSGKTEVQQYKWDEARKAPVLESGKQQYDAASLLSLRVYDLYYKTKVTTLRQWWKLQDSGMGGTIKLALLHTIDD